MPRSAIPQTQPPRYALGVDVGGTKIAAGVVDIVTGEMQSRREVPTQAARGGQAVLDTVTDLCRALLDAAQGPIEAIGVGVCELVDPAGDVQSAHTVAWQGLPVRDALAQVAPADATVLVESDVRAHAVAEAWFGAGAEYDLFVFVTVGTGISSCLVQALTPLAGAQGNALVLASAPLEIPVTTADGRETIQTFVLEEYASGSALLQRFERATGEQLAHGRELFARAAQAGAPGNEQARHILNSAGAALGNSIAFLVNILDPQAVIIGGGLGVAGGLYWDALVAATRRGIYADNSRELPLRPAYLGGDAGIIGAAKAAACAAGATAIHKQK
ncbi:MAG: ROK family protein [Litorilinea sp.]